MWRDQDDGDSIAVPITNLSKDEFSEDELNYQLGEVVYEDNLFVHKGRNRLYAQRVFGGDIRRVYWQEEEKD